MAIGRILALAVLIAQPAWAADPDYRGTWVIAEARPAPWIGSEAELFPDEKRRLIGAKVTYGQTSIDGPAPLACDKPVYEMLDVPPEGLFQGGLALPAEQAQALGFRSRTIPTLQTGCEGWIDFHFVDGRTALFALNNMIYTLRKQ